MANTNIEIVDKFTKEQLLKAAVFSNRKDALNVVLEDEKLYSVEEAQDKLEKFMKGKVN